MIQFISFCNEEFYKPVGMVLPGRCPEMSYECPGQCWKRTDSVAVSGVNVKVVTKDLSLPFYPKNLSVLFITGNCG